MEGRATVANRPIREPPGGSECSPADPVGMSVRPISSSIEAGRWSSAWSTIASGIGEAGDAHRPAAGTRSDPMQQRRGRGHDRRLVIGDQAVAATRGDGVDRPRDREHLTSVVDRRRDGEQGARAIRRLDHDHRAGQPGDDAVASREIRLARRMRPGPAPRPGRRRSPPAGRQGRDGGAGRCGRAAKAGPRRSGRRQRPRPRAPAPSIPMARPLTTVTPARASSSAISAAARSAIAAGAPRADDRDARTPPSRRVARPRTAPAAEGRRRRAPAG